MRRECLDQLLIFGRRHLERVLQEYAIITTGTARTLISRWARPSLRWSRPGTPAPCVLVLVSLV
jgi:hypothetical protein